jgi:hypothetical protein
MLALTALTLFMTWASATTILDPETDPRMAAKVRNQADPPVRSIRDEAGIERDPLQRRPEPKVERRR